MFKTQAFAAAALCTAVLFSSPAAFAKDAVVRYGDLDLATSEGQGALKARLDRAARGVCAYDVRDTGALLPSRSATQCYRLAKASSEQRFAAAVQAERSERLGG